MQQFLIKSGSILGPFGILLSDASDEEKVPFSVKNCSFKALFGKFHLKSALFLKNQTLPLNSSIATENVE